MILERQDNGIVNWNNVFRVDIEKDYTGDDTLSFSVRAHAPGVEDANYMQPTSVVLYESPSKSDCEAYLEWLKREMKTPRHLILHTFVSPSTGEEPAQRMGKLWHNQKDCDGQAPMKTPTGMFTQDTLPESLVRVTEQTELRMAEGVFFKNHHGLFTEGVWGGYLNENGDESRVYSMIHHGEQASLVRTDALLRIADADADRL